MREQSAGAQAERPQRPAAAAESIERGATPGTAVCRLWHLREAPQQLHGCAAVGRVRRPRRPRQAADKCERLRNVSSASGRGGQGLLAAPAPARRDTHMAAVTLPWRPRADTVVLAVGFLRPRARECIGALSVSQFIGDARAFSFSVSLPFYTFRLLSMGPSFASSRS